MAHLAEPETKLFPKNLDYSGSSSTLDLVETFVLEMNRTNPSSETRGQNYSTPHERRICAMRGNVISLLI